MMYWNSFFIKNEKAFVATCKKYRVKTMYAFGSSVTDRFDSKSDIDLVVDLFYLEPLEYGEALLNLWDELELLFQRKVDLLTDHSIKNPYLKKEIDATKRLIYDGQREEIFI